MTFLPGTTSERDLARLGVSKLQLARNEADAALSTKGRTRSQTLALVSPPRGVEKEGAGGTGKLPPRQVITSEEIPIVTEAVNSDPQTVMTIPVSEGTSGTKLMARTRQMVRVSDSLREAGMNGVSMSSSEMREFADQSELTFYKSIGGPSGGEIGRASCRERV